MHSAFRKKDEVHPSTTTSEPYPQRALVLTSAEVRANETVLKPQRDGAPAGAGIQLPNSIAVRLSRVKRFGHEIVRRRREKSLEKIKRSTLESVKR